MNKFPQAWLAMWLLGLGFGAACGCSRVPPTPPKAKVDPTAAAQAAIDAYDADKDGKLDSKELEKSPPLKAAMERIDKDHTGAITAGMIKDRINAWLASGTTIMEGSAMVTLDGKPLEGATVTFDPEPFLGPGFTACSGTTNATGLVVPKGPLEKYSGIYVGLYRVRISKKVNGQEIIPARYNTETTLGVEIAEDVVWPMRQMAFALESK